MRSPIFNHFTSDSSAPECRNSTGREGLAPPAGVEHALLSDCFLVILPARLLLGYGGAVYEIRRSTAFDAWLTNLSDSNARARIAARIDRLAWGNPGDVKPVGGGVSEMRIDYGPGYRLYYARMDRVVYLLLCGGTKATQDADIKRAIEMNAARAREVSAASVSPRAHTAE